MSIFTMTGAELAAAVSVPAVAATHDNAYPKASPALAHVLAGITNLSAADQAALAKAFRAAEPRKSRAIGVRKSYTCWDDFMPAYTRAREAAARAVGVRWYLDPAVTVKARVPVAWVACKLSRSTSTSPRDINVPRAEFWPDGLLPLGPEYAEHGPIDPAGNVHTIAERRASHRRAAMGAAFPRLAMAMRPQFELEQTPDGEMDTSKLAAD
jgi:hypothetical protein